MKERSLPLGIDLGATRVRIAALSRRDDGAFRLLGAGAADVGEDARGALFSALEQVETHERRCVAMIRSCDARLQTVVLPAMARRDADRAAVFEALAGFQSERDTLTVRSLTLECNAGGERRMFVAAAPRRLVRETVSRVASAGLRPVCVEPEACALARASKMPLLDVGLARSSLIACIDGAPFVRTFDVGGIHFTKALARDYGMSRELAEARKQTIGLAGAARDILDAFIEFLGSELRSLREEKGLDVNAIRLCGNGTRLPDLRDAIEQELAIRAGPIELNERLAMELPVEAQRSAAVDWFAAIAAALPPLA